MLETTHVITPQGMVLAGFRACRLDRPTPAGDDGGAPLLWLHVLVYADQVQELRGHRGLELQVAA